MFGGIGMQEMLLIFLVILLAVQRHRFGRVFRVLVILAVVINLFGALTFDRAHQFYDDDRTQERMFQPD